MLILFIKRIRLKMKGNGASVYFSLYFWVIDALLLTVAALLIQNRAIPRAGTWEKNFPREQVQLIEVDKYGKAGWVSLFQL